MEAAVCKKRKYRWVFWTLGIVAAFAAVFFIIAPPFLDDRLNSMLHKGPHEVSAAAQRLHATLTVADLHADSLLWNRDLLARNERGHVDIPRLREGGVALQVFSIVTKSPRGQNIEHNTADTDNITPLAIVQLWPPRTWFSLAPRVFYQAEKLERFARASGGGFVVIRTASELKAFLARREQDRSLTAGVLAIEGAHALERDLDNLDRFFAAGVRMVSPSHFFDNAIGGSAHGVVKGGLTDLGKEMVRRLEAKGFLLDLAHASPAVIDDALAIARNPVVVSHTGVQGTCNNTRNLSDRHLRAIAQNGGLVGIGFWDAAVCDTSVAGIVRGIQHVARTIGVGHVALGSDFDGAITTPFDASGMAMITQGLMRAGFSEDDIRRIMGGNVVELLARALPP
jgi:microsomal dipeptidase-like Zn-dependent dipeptidase